MPYSFRSEQWLPYPVDTVFAFLADPANLPALMPEWQRSRLVEVSLVPPRRAAGAADSAKAAGAGTRLVLSLRPIPHLPIRVRWHAEIVEFAWNDRFSDRQISGPFAWWEHHHRVRALDNNGVGVTILTDEIEYEMPFGALGRLAHSMFVRQRIEEAFNFRHAQIAAALALASRPAAQKTSRVSQETSRAS